MSKITIAGDRVVVTSAVTLENLKLIHKLRPDALCLKDLDGNETFRVSVGSNSITSKGVSYAKATYTGDGLATATVLIPDGTVDVKEHIVDTYGLAISNLNKVEAQLPEVVLEITRERDELLASITTSPGSAPNAQDDDD